MSIIQMGACIHHAPKSQFSGWNLKTVIGGMSMIEMLILAIRLCAELVKLVCEIRNLRTKLRRLRKRIAKTALEQKPQKGGKRKK